MPVRVLIVDDSPFIREVLREGLSQYADIEIVGEASDGKRAERMVMELRPDVVTMDVVMPMVGGMEAIRSIMARCPTPIVVVSDVQGDHNLLSLQAMEAGAIDTFAKPRAGFDRAAADKLADLLRAAAHIRVLPRQRTSDPVAPARRPPRQRARRVEFAGVAASTGGPQTLRRLLQELSRQGGDVPPMAIVQHTAVGFTGALISWLDSYAGFSVSMAQEGKRVESGTIVVAPDDRHLEILPGGIMHLSDGPKLGGHRPSATLLLQSLARSFGPAAAGIILTGMGSDGAEGIRAIEDQGGLALIEDPAGAIIEGMPKAAIQLTSAPIVGSITQIARALVRQPPVQGRP